jgi:hypothetical protein
MGKKERIADLEKQSDDLGRSRDLLATSAAAANMLIQQIGREVGVIVNEQIVPSNASEYGARILAAIRAVRQRARTDGAATDEVLSGSRMEAPDHDIDREIDHANEVLHNEVALAKADPLFGDVPTTTLVSGVIDAIARIAREFDLDTTDSPGEALGRIHLEILRLKNPSGDVTSEADNPALSKGDSLAQAIEHNAAERDHLHTELTRARAIISRIAAAMQIGTWDADGTQILEKVQRWETLKHVLSRRIHELRSGSPDPSGNIGKQWHAARPAIAIELEHHLARLMAPKEFAKWLEGKPPGVVTPAVAELAEQPPATDQAATEMMSAGDIVRLSRVIRQSVDVSDVLIGFLDRVFGAMARSVEASSEFLNLMNLVVLPLLARQAAARGAGAPVL